MCNCTDLKQRIKELEDQISEMNVAYFPKKGVHLRPFSRALDKSNSGLKDILNVLKIEVLFDLYEAAIRVILFVLAELKNRGVGEDEYKLHYKTIFSSLSIENNH